MVPVFQPEPPAKSLMAPRQQTDRGSSVRVAPLDVFLSAVFRYRSAPDPPSRGTRPPLINPGLPGKPFVVDLADWAACAREEHRSASKAVAVRFYARRDRAPGLTAFDHKDSHLEPPWFATLGQSVLQDPGEALLDRLGGLGRDLLNQLPQLLVLRGYDVEILVSLFGRKLDDIRQRLCIH